MAPIPVVDRRWEELARVYRDAYRRLEELVREAIEKGAAGTAAYRAAQLEAVITELAKLQDVAVPDAKEAIEFAYRLGGRATDQVLGRPEFGFSGVHVRALEVLVANMVGRLGDAHQLVGRRTDDVFREISIKEIAAGIATGSGPKDVATALERRLVREGVTDALTGFVDSRGHRWQLDTYAEMVARTTTREAVSFGTANRLLEQGFDLVTVSTHANSCPICLPFQGKTYSLTGRTGGYEKLPGLPPFHPNCRHVIAPAAATFDAFERALEAAA